MRVSVGCKSCGRKGSANRFAEAPEIDLPAHQRLIVDIVPAPAQQRTKENDEMREARSGQDLLKGAEVLSAESGFDFGQCPQGETQTIGAPLNDKWNLAAS